MGHNGMRQAFKKLWFNCFRCGRRFADAKRKGFIGPRVCLECREGEEKPRCRS